MLAAAESVFTVCPRLELTIMYGSKRSDRLSDGAWESRVLGQPNDRRKDSKLWTNLDPAKELNDCALNGRT